MIRGPSGTGSVTVRSTSMRRPPASTALWTTSGEAQPTTRCASSASSPATTPLPSRPKMSSGRRLGGDERELHAVDPRAPDVPGGDDRELVERQAPCGAARDDERDAAGVALLEVGQQAGQRLGGSVGAERDRVCGTRCGSGRRPPPAASRNRRSSRRSVVTLRPAGSISTSASRTSSASKSRATSASG